MKTGDDSSPASKKCSYTASAVSITPIKESAASPVHQWPRPAPDADRVASYGANLSVFPAVTAVAAAAAADVRQHQSPVTITID